MKPERQRVFNLRKCLIHVYTQRKKGTKTVPWGTIATNGTLFQRGTLFSLFSLKKRETVPLCQWGTKIVPLRVPYYGQSNSAPRGTVLVPFFLSVPQ